MNNCPSKNTDGNITKSIALSSFVIDDYGGNCQKQCEKGEITIDDMYVTTDSDDSQTSGQSITCNKYGSHSCNLDECDLFPRTKKSPNILDKLRNGITLSRAT